MTGALEDARAIMREVVLPLERTFLAGGFAAVDSALADARLEVRRRGLWAPHLPRELGGAGLSSGDFARLSAILGESPLGHFAFNCQAPDVGNMELLARHGSSGQKQKWLAPLVQGEVRSCFAMTEPEHAGSNPVWMSSRADRDGDDYVISAHKWFASSADGASFAVVMAVTNPDAGTHERASLFIVPADADGFRRVRNIPVMGDAGSGWASHSELMLERVRVPAANRIGEEGAGFALAQERLGPGRIHHCMRWIGICERAFALMCERSLQRELSPGSPLADKQVVQHWIADSRAEIDAATLLVLDTAHRLESEGARSVRERVSLIKFHVAGVLQRVLDRAIQSHGALGLTDETPLSFWYAHERAARIYDGPDEVHRDIVAREALRKFRAAAG